MADLVSTAVTGKITGDRERDAQNQAYAYQREALDKSLAAQKEAQQRAIAEYRAGTDRGVNAINQGFAQGRTDLAPLRDAQAYGVDQIRAQLGEVSDPNNPLYNQQRDVATQALQRQLAAQGLLRSKSQVDLLGNLELGLAQQRAQQRSQLAGYLGGLGAIERSAGLSAQQGLSTGNLYAGLGNTLGGLESQYGNIYAQGQLAYGDLAAQNAMRQAEVDNQIYKQLNNAHQYNVAQFGKAFATMYGGGAGAAAGGGIGNGYQEGKSALDNWSGQQWQSGIGGGGGAGGPSLMGPSEGGFNYDKFSLLF